MSPTKTKTIYTFFSQIRIRLTSKPNISLNKPTVYYVPMVHKELEKYLNKTLFYLRGGIFLPKRKWKMKVCRRFFFN